MEVEHFASTHVKQASPLIGTRTCITLICIFGFLSCVILVLRTWERRRRNEMLFDILFTAAALLPLMLSSAFAIKVAIDEPTLDNEHENYLDLRKYSLLTNVACNTGSGLVKISYLLVHIRIFTHTTTRYRYTVWILVVIVSLHSLILISLPFGTCFASPAYWYHDDRASRKAYECIPEGRFIMVTTVISLILDLAGALVSTALYWTQLPRNQRPIMIRLFCGGYFIFLFGILRCRYNWKVLADYDTASAMRYISTLNALDLINSTIWTTLPLTWTTLSSCIEHLWSMIRKHRRSAMDESKDQQQESLQDIPTKSSDQRLTTLSLYHFALWQLSKEEALPTMVV